MERVEISILDSLKKAITNGLSGGIKYKHNCCWKCSLTAGRRALREVFGSCVFMERDCIEEKICGSLAGKQPKVT